MDREEGHFKNLLSHSAIYGLGRLIGQAAAFLLIPIYTRTLTTESYGVLALLTMTMSVLGIILGMGLGSAFFRYYFSVTDEKAKAYIIDSAFFMLLAISLAAVFVLLPLSAWLSRVLFGSNIYTLHLKYIFCAVFFNTLSIIPLGLLRAEERSFRYSAIVVTKLVFMLGLNILFVVVLRKEVLGIFQANLLSAGGMFLILAISFFRRSRLRLSWSQMKILLLFGAPLMPTQIASWVLTLSDRYLLKYLGTLREVGIYTLGYNLGFVVNLLIVGPFSVAWGPFMYKVAREQGASETYAHTLTYIGLAAGSVALFLSLFSPLIVTIVSPPAYYTAHQIIPLVAFSYVLYGMYFVFTAGLNITKRTYYFPLIVGLAAGLNIVLNFIFIPRHGMMAAAWSTFVSYLLLAFMTCSFSQKFFRVRYEYGRLLKITLALAIVLAGGFATNSYSGLFGLTIKMLLFLAFPVLLYVLSFFRDGEITKLLGILKLR